MKKKYFSSECALILGLLINALAVTLYIQSEKGVSTISSIPFVLNQVVPWLSLGVATILFQLLLIGILLVVIGWDTRYLYAMGLGLIFGMVLDVYKILFDQFSVQKINGWVLFALAYLLLSFGISLMLHSGLTALPFDIFVGDLAKKTGKSLKIVKTIFDVVCVALTGLLSVTFLGGIRGIGVGTLISMIMTGVAVDFFHGLLQGRFRFAPLKARHEM